jgi:hypothetical protein
MRNRHIPRVCRHCDAPMASGAGTCWRCGVEWASEDGPATALRLVRGGRPDEGREAPPAVPAPRRVAAAALARS